MIQAVYYGYQSFVTQTGQLIYQESEFTGFIRRAMLQHFNYACEDSILELLATDMYLYFNQRVYRQALVDWIIEAGFTNLKLWGQGWQESTKYKKYAMGVAPNGETLSKIYQASKIVVGNNTLHCDHCRGKSLGIYVKRRILYE